MTWLIFNGYFKIQTWKFVLILLLQQSKFKSFLDGSVYGKILIHNSCKEITCWRIFYRKTQLWIEGGFLSADVPPVVVQSKNFRRLHCLWCNRIIFIATLLQELHEELSRGPTPLYTAGAYGKGIELRFTAGSTRFTSLVVAVGWGSGQQRKNEFFILGFFRWRNSNLGDKKNCFIKTTILQCLHNYPNIICK